MIKRRFYRLEHADGDGAADSSSSSSDSEIEVDATESESEENNGDDDNVAVGESNQNDKASSTSSGYESEASSADEMNVDSTRVGREEEEEEEEEIENDEGMFVDSQISSERGNDVRKCNLRAGKLSVPMPSDVPDCIFKIKSVFRCRICPRIVCLSEETMKAHLKSKRHARSEKLMKENRLKAILNSNGQIENQETAAEMHARIVALAEDSKKTKKSNRRQRRRKMSGKKEKVVKDSATKKSKEETGKPAKKKHQSEN